jgi:xanthine phosphoribosyltransferase
MTQAKKTIGQHQISWDDFLRDTRQLARRLRKLGPWDGIIAVTRGGLVPATIVSKMLGIKRIDTVCISSYRGKKQGKHTVLKGLAGDGAGLLIVDDLVDTGKTAKLLKKMLPKAHMATVIAKPAGKPYVDTFVSEVRQNTWIVFPWDTV